MVATRNRSLFALALGIVVLAIVVWWISAGGETAAPDRPPAEGPTAASPPGTPERRAVSSAVAGSSSIEREHAVPAAEESGPRHVTVRVVDESGQPVAGAEVGWHVERVPEDYRHDDRERERLAFAGELRTSDAEGRVSIPFEDVLSWTVYGRDADRFGLVFVPIAQAAEVHELHLVRDITIRAQVIDPGGRPVAGVRVALADDAGIERFSMQVFRETTEPDGIVTFHHAQQFIRDDWGNDGAVLLGFPLERPVFARVEFDAVAAEPYVLQLPGTGSVHVELVDRDGRPVEDLTETVYARLYQLLQGNERRFWLPFDGPRLDLLHVGIGLRFRLELSSPGVSGVLEFAGPTAWGERVEHRLTVTRNPTLSGRLVDEHGVPQAGYWYATHVQQERGYYNQYFETGENGLFHTAVPGLPSEPEERGVIFRRTITNLEQQAFFDLADLGLTEGRNELGDVVLRRPPILVAGQIVDDAGAPVADANVMVLQGDPEEEAWTIGGLSNRDDTSAEDGTFELRVHHVGGRLSLYAEHGDNTGPMVPFVVGATGVRYVLPRVGSARMAVTFEGGLTSRDLLFCHRNEATQVTTSVVSHYAIAASPEPENGEVARWQALRPGRYDFSIRALGSPEPLVEVRGIEIKGGEEVELPAQRLGEGMHTLTVRVVDEDGRPVERATVVVDPGRLGDRPRTALPTKLGERRLLVPRLPVDLQILAPGFATQDVRGVARDVTVRMPVGRLVELAVKLPSGRPGAGQRLHPQIQRYRPPGPEPWDTEHALYLRGAGRMWYPARHSWLWAPKAVLDGNGRASFRVPAAGEYEIEWSLRGNDTIDLPPRAKRRFTVAEHETVTRVELELTEADFGH